MEPCCLGHCGGCRCNNFTPSLWEYAQFHLQWSILACKVSPHRFWSWNVLGSECLLDNFWISSQHSQCKKLTSYPHQRSVHVSMSTGNGERQMATKRVWEPSEISANHSTNEMPCNNPNLGRSGFTQARQELLLPPPGRAVWHCESVKL